MRPDDRYTPSEHLHPEPTLADLVLSCCRPAKALKRAEERAQRCRALELRLTGRVEHFVNPKLEQAE